MSYMGIDIRKLANAFIPRASPSDLMLAEALSAIDRFKRKYGGLWVGGTVSISQSGVSFSPNWLNRKIHDALEPIRFRCYGAKNLAATMAASFDVSSTK